MNLAAKGRVVMAEFDLSVLPAEFIDHAINVRRLFGSEALRKFIKRHLVLKSAPATDAGYLCVGVGVVWPLDEPAADAGTGIFLL